MDNSSNITNEIDILADADEEFVNIVHLLETTADYKERSTFAQAYIIGHNYLQKIYYKTLLRYLNDYTACDIKIWRQLYLLERSIPPRQGDKYTWLERLKVFASTYLVEANVVKNYIFEGHKVYWRNGTGNNKDSHLALLMGSNMAACSDFYYWLDDMPKGQQMQGIELKYCYNPVEEEAIRYKVDPKAHNHLYDAKLLTLYEPNERCYYLVDYRTEPNAITKLDIPAPDGVFNV